MAKYINISSATNTTLRKKNINGGNLTSLTIVNYDLSDSVTATLYLDDNTNEYRIISTKMRPLTTLVLGREDNIAYDSRVYDLKLHTDTTASLTVTMK
tara:strand:- start:198 stop:491 length:294 start_codon:yes stop_codon:yes gene_type:complete